MRTTAIFFAYLLACLTLAALLTYPVMLTGWIDHDPQRVMGRIAQILILLGLWPFLTRMGLADWSTLGFGIERSAFLHSLFRGWLAGVLILLLLVASLLLLGVRVPHLPDGLPGLILEKAIAAFIGGLLIGLLEEAFFRGALFTGIRRRNGLFSALIWSASLYALLHFMKPHELPEGMEFDWTGTWFMLTHVFTSVAQWQHLDSMVALFLAGLLLALVRERTGHIGWCIGLHAGWVFVIQLTRRLSNGDDAASLAFLAGDYDGVIGWLAALWIGFLALLYWRWSEPMVKPADAAPQPD
ncbi:MAG TPA: CPBP family intramembrane metalloprotease [Chromatiaceae bacterium]|nr:MAG: hypothetical protein N838_10010 [Thiohalocapsa sp. PB-PSB1]QQO55712.1 MAG: CPBP family intramembrane metalloprotease [Thiohalocapsa sp. PB-PSB1]HBG93810.1 CPBP family intramembrane metalloprotease [Chromatiaceae bacterium]HCS90029.1 CPBP family intramembrane metalloprotease [Chromatiaceae bacterium]